MKVSLQGSIIIALAAAGSHAFLTPSGRRHGNIRYNTNELYFKPPSMSSRGILELAEASSSTVFPTPTETSDAFLGNYEDLVMPGKEGHGYQLIFEDEESLRLYVKKNSAPVNHNEARQRARENIGFFSDRDTVGNVPETKNVASNVEAMRKNIDFFSSHAFGTILDSAVHDDSQARANARNHIDFFSSASAIHLPKDTAMDATEARNRARENIDFFSLKEHTASNKIDGARQEARQNIDFFSPHGVVSSEKARDESKERITARSNIGFFS